MSFWQAVNNALKTVRCTGDTAGRPSTIGEAVAAYKMDLTAQGRSIVNATRVSKQPATILSSQDRGPKVRDRLRTWRNDLIAGGMKRPTYVRVAKAAKAALSLCARRNPRIGNAMAWRIGLGGIGGEYKSGNILRLTDRQIRAVIKAAYKLDRAFGLVVEVAAVGGRLAAREGARRMGMSRQR